MKTSRLPLDTFGEQAGLGESGWTDAGHSVWEQLHYICRTSGPSGHQREMLFLRRLMLDDNTDERRELEQKLARTERKECCAQRAMWWMGILTAVAIAGLGYSLIVLEDYPSDFTSAIIRIFCALGLSAIVSLLAFFAFWSLCRNELNKQREQCRRLVMRIVESRLGKPAVISSAEMSKPNVHPAAWPEKTNGPPNLKNRKQERLL
jgi:hypothetical protein